MKQQINIYTETMAKLYAQQGHWAKAAEIYRQLAKREPGRKDYAEALAEVNKKRGASPPKSDERLESLFREWIELLLRNDQLKKLGQLKNRM
jgi:hypothetical protein